MTIDLNGPKRLIFDISALTHTLDRDEELSPLTWQYVIERDLAALGDQAVVSCLPYCPSLANQYRILKSLQTQEGLDVTIVLGPEVLNHLRAFVLSIELTTQTLIISKQKPTSMGIE